MRDTKQMLELMLRAAREDERIRAVLLQGSRADPNAEPDIFQEWTRKVGGVLLRRSEGLGRVHVLEAVQVSESE